MEKMAVTHDDVTMDELQNISAAMQRHVRSETEQSYEEITTALKRRGSFFGLFPTAIQKANEQLTIEKMRTLYKAKDQFFQLYTNVQLEIARKRGDALVAAVGTDMQTKLASFVAVKIKEIQGTVNDSRVAFLESMKPQFENVETYRDIPDLYEPAYASVREQTVLYFESMSKLLKGFNEAMDGKLAQFRS